MYPAYTRAHFEGTMGERPPPFPRGREERHYHPPDVMMMMRYGVVPLPHRSRPRRGRTFAIPHPGCSSASPGNTTPAPAAPQRGMPPTHLSRGSTSFRGHLHPRCQLGTEEDVTGRDRRRRRRRRRGGGFRVLHNRRGWTALGRGGAGGTRGGRQRTRELSITLSKRPLMKMKMPGELIL